MDLIGTLPDEVLCHVLSFFTTKEAALTSTLSTRWRTLWTRVPNIDIDDSVFLHPEEGKREREGILASFMDFVDRLLLSQGKNFPVKRFSLKCKTGIDRERVNRWICNVLERGLEDLELVLDFPRYNVDDTDYQYLLPSEMFVSKTLVKITLSSEFGVDWWRGGTGTCSPMLKCLDIQSEWVLLSNRLDVFLAGFPVLEEFYLAGTDWNDSDHSVLSASLRRLTIYADGFEDIPMSISFDTPNLVYLEYADYIAGDYPKVNLTNLVEAFLDLKVTEDQLTFIHVPYDDDYEFLYLRNVSKLVSGLRNVQRLFLSADSLDAFSLSCESMPVFKNLKYLRLRSSKDRGWSAMPVLLRNCPHLETLVLEGLLHYATGKCGDACNCFYRCPREDTGRSLLSCPVKKLQITRFQGTIREKELIRHFLECFPSLEEMEVYAGEQDPTNLEEPRFYKIVANKVHEEISTKIVRQSQLIIKDGLVLPGSLSQTQMYEISSQFAPRNNKHIYDMVFMMHGHSPLALPPPTQEMSEDFYQPELIALNAKMVDLNEKQWYFDAEMAGLMEKKERFNALFDRIFVDHPMVAAALRARQHATDSEEGEVSKDQVLSEKKRDFKAMFEILAEQILFPEVALRFLRVTNLERGETSKDKEMTGIDQD